MAVASDKNVKITFTVEDKVTGKTKKIVDDLDKGITKITSSVKGMMETSEGWREVTLKSTETQKTWMRSLKDGTETVSKLGRQIGFTGFILSFTAQRIIKSIGGMVKSFLSVGAQMADTDKAVGWLGDTLEGLALAGLLTKERGQEVIETFGSWFDAANTLKGEFTLLDIEITKVKTAIAVGMAEALGGFNEDLDEIDWDGFNEDVEEASRTLTEDLIEAVKIALGVEGEGGLTGLGEKVKAVSEFLGGFAKGVGRATNRVLTLAGAFNTASGEDGEGGAAGFGESLGDLLTTMVIIGIPLSILGSAISGITEIFKLATGALGKLASAFGLPGTALGLLGALAAIILVVGTVIYWWDELVLMWQTHVEPAVGRLAKAFGMEGDGLGRNIDDAIKFALKPLAIMLMGIIVIFGKIIDGIADVINAFKNLIKKQKEWAKNKRPGPVDTDEDVLGGEQWGGVIPKTGLYQMHKGEYVQPVVGRGSGGGGGGGDTVTHVYVMLDGMEIAHHVSRSQGKRVRSTLLLP